MPHDRGTGITVTATKEALMRLILILLLLFAASAPTVWGQDAGGDDEDEMHDGHGSEAVGDEEPEPDEGADSEAMDEPEAEAEEAIDDESEEFADEDELLADEESDAGDDDAGADNMPDDEGSDTDMTESEGGDTSSEETSDPAETGESEADAEDASTVASEQAEEEEEADDTADDEDIVEADDAAADAPDGEMQLTDGGQVESAGGNGANANPQAPAAAGTPPPVVAQPSSVPELAPCPPVAQPGAGGTFQIFVGNLSESTSEDQLMAAFVPYGTVERVRIVTDSSTGRRRGFAFVGMQDPQSGQQAVENLNGADLNGHKLQVSEVRPMPAGTQGSGRTRGGGSVCNRGGAQQGNRRIKW